MTPEELKRLYEKCASGQATPEEQRLFESYQDDFDLSDIPWSAEMGDAAKVEAGLRAKMENYLSKDKAVKYVRWRYTIAALVLLSGSLLIWKLKEDTKPVVAVVPKKEVIKPGTDKATLTLSNGQVIPVDQVNSGLISTQSNITITKNSKGQIIYAKNGKLSPDAKVMNVMTTPRGGQHKLILADGTAVWLNAQTSLKYPVYFSGKERVVELAGEAYFEVAHDAAKPFKVISRGQTIEVLGTHFDVKAYPDESTISTTLLIGSVKITAENNKVVLKPGQQATFSAGKSINLREVNENDAIAWKNGYFLFRNEGIESCMKTIARWYDVDIVYQGDAVNRRLGGTVSRYENLSDLLATIELTKSVRFKIEGRRVIVMQ